MNEEERTTEVRTSEVQDGATNVQRQTVATARKADVNVVAQRVVWYIAGFIITFLALRLVLLLLGAQQGNFFVDLVYNVGGFFSAPFQGIFGEPTYGSMYFDASSLVAIVVYTLLAWGIAKAFTLTGSREV
ncbi:YggT family protein [Candidatus Saccharibacteria bacterium]|nr:YggT family protein [Candidatus Saccharibacteria bacterium]